MPALPALLSALSALLVTLNGLYVHSPASTTPVTGIFGPVASSTPMIPGDLLPAPITIPIPGALPTTPAAPSSLGSLIPEAPSTDLAIAITSLKNAIVNIVCTSSEPGIPSTSGSGVIFDKRGLILTNSHIAQFYLLHAALPSSVSCVVRTGSPAQSAYRAELAYISSQWIKEHPDTLVVSVPKGTGEHDFAVLVITGSATPIPLPSSFSYVPLTKDDIGVSDDVAVGSYPAQNMSYGQVQNSLYPALVFAKVKNVYTFEGTTEDLLALGGSVAAQPGSSGGGVVNEDGELVAVITTSSRSGEYASRDLRGITIDHIRRSFEEDSGEDFDSYFKNGSLPRFVAVFKDDTATLSAFLMRAIGR